jgi:hypothetical protein
MSTTNLHCGAQLSHAVGARLAASRRVFYSLRALTERPAAKRYRATFTSAALSRDDFARMAGDPSAPVVKRADLR